MKKLLLLIPIIIYVVASAWANFDLFPEGFMEYWWFDDLGHVVVFGAVALSLAYVTDKLYAHAYIGFTAAVFLAVADELAQAFIPARSFTLHDLQMSLVGIALAAVLYWLVRFVLRQRVNHRQSSSL